jgi:hypothetical protein
MRVFVRLVGGIWLATLLVTGVFAYVEIHAERTRLEQDLQRRTSLVVEALRDSAAPVVGKGSRAPSSAWCGVSGVLIAAWPSSTSSAASSRPART